MATEAFASPHTAPVVQQGRPDDAASRLPKEQAVYDLLDALQVSYLRVDHAPIFTAEGCAWVKQLLGIPICKNLFLTNAAHTRYDLLLMPGEKRFVTREFSRLIGSSRLSFASEEALLQLLNLTPGSVSVFGLMNDTDNRVSLWIDEDVLAYDGFGCHPCINTSSLRFSTADLLQRILPAMHHTCHTVRLTGQ